MRRQNGYLSWLYSQLRCDDSVQELEQHSDTDTDDQLFLDELDLWQKDKNQLFTNLNVNNEDIRFKVDTRAQCNVIPEHNFEKLTRKPKLQTPKIKLMAYGGIRVPIKGTCTTNIKQDTKTINAEFFIVTFAKV